jgi:AraC family transcriptional regulator of adaptative response / DNA-3-methyladenine glycosylase II
MPGARKIALKELAQAAAADPQLFRPFGTIEEAIARLRSIRGIGEWTAQYIALRGLHEPDAFPAADAGLLRAASRLGGLGSRPSPADLRAHAERWRPWRAYAAQHLWTHDASEARATTDGGSPTPAARARRAAASRRAWRTAVTAA